MGRPNVSGQPANYPWAVSTPNYPAGPNPWNGQPIKVVPAGDYFTPNTHPPAEDFNYNLNQLGVVDQAILDWTKSEVQGVLDWTGNDIVNNWQQPKLTSSIISSAFPGVTNNNGLVAVAWNQFRYAWDGLFDMTVPGPLPIFQIARNTGTDTTWVATGTSTGSSVLSQTGTDMLHDPELFDTIYVASPSVGGGFKVFKYVDSTDTWSTLLTVSDGHTYDACTLAFFGHSPTRSLIVGVTDAAGTNTAIYGSPDRGSTWSHTTYAGQKGRWYFDYLVTGAGFEIFGGVSGSGGVFPMVIHSLTGAIGTWSSPHGLGLAGQSLHGMVLTFITVGTTETLALVTNVGDKLLQTTDGATWNTIYTATGGVDQVDDMKGSGNLIVYSIKLPSFVFRGSDDMMTIFSVSSSVGNWWPTGGVLRPTASYRPRVVSNRVLSSIGAGILEATQFGIFRDAAVMFSAIAGTPPVAIPF